MESCIESVLLCVGTPNYISMLTLYKAKNYAVHNKFIYPVPC